LIVRPDGYIGFAANEKVASPALSYMKAFAAPHQSLTASNLSF
jgi:hypothetical protein